MEWGLLSGYITESRVHRFTQKHPKTPQNTQKHPHTPQKRIESYTNI